MSLDEFFRVINRLHHATTDPDAHADLDRLYGAFLAVYRENAQLRHEQRQRQEHWWERLQEVNLS